MCRRILTLVTFSIITITYADSVIQTDWSGTPGVWGPVIEWCDDFYFKSNVECSNPPGDIVLSIGVITHSIDSMYNGANAIYFEDIDGDGMMDLISNALYDDLSWWKNDNGSGTSWSEHIISSTFGGNSIHSEDIDGDGDMDIIGTSWYGRNVSWWENVDGSGTSWIRYFIEKNYLSAQSAYSEDIDGDGDMDVLASSFFDDTVTWWENSDTGQGIYWVEHTIDNNVSGVRAVYCEDFDGDGDMDVLGAIWTLNNIAWWENVDGSGTVWAKWMIDLNFPDPWDVYSEDIDSDGDMDVLGGGDGITWWENISGSGISWAEHTVVVAFNGVNSVYSEDMDSDGDMDILGASWNDGISWWENIDGSGISWVQHFIASNSTVKSVFPHDINDDGNMDIAAAVYQYDDLFWCDIDAYSDGILESSSLYLQNDPGWGTIDWTATEPQGTSVAFQVRSCDSPDSTGMGAWSDTLFFPCSLQGILSEDDSYFQYRALLLTTESSVTPVLEDITITWNPLGTGEGEPLELELLPFTPNPASAPEVRFCLPEPSSVDISIFDLSGRLIIEIHGDEYSPGFQEVPLGDISSGIYFCRMISGGFTATRRFIVVE